MSWKEKILDVVDDFLTVRSFITLGAFGTVYWMSWTKQIPVDTITHIMDVLLGFWFGSKIANASTGDGK